MSRILLRNLVALGFLLNAAACLAQSNNPVGDGVDAAIAKSGSTRVLVMFDAGPLGNEKASDSGRIEQIRAVRESILGSAKSADYKVRRTFATVPGFAVELNAKALEALRQDSRVQKIDLDLGGHGHLSQARPLARMTDVFNLGLRGAGTKVAVIDSGIDLTHPDFAGRIVGEQCFCAGPSGTVGCCPNALDTQSGSGAAADDHGHGTNVTGIVAGAGGVAQPGGAPAASIVSVKVLDSNNSFCCTSDVVAGLDWVLTQHPDTKVVNASLGTGTLFSSSCDTSSSFSQAMATAVNNLVANGTMVFASTGNQRSATSTSAPACVVNTIAVGAVYDSAQGNTFYSFFGCGDNNTQTDQATCFTNSNATVDMYAPGASITSTGRGGGLSTFTGTSQATPLAAGCAAAIRAQYPSATLSAVEAALKASPTRITDPKNGLSFPRLDCLDALMRVQPTQIFRNGFE